MTSSPVRVGPFSHRESFSIGEPCRTVDAMEVERIVRREVDAVVAPVTAKLQQIARSLDQLDARQRGMRDKADRLAEKAAPLVAVRDAQRRAEAERVPAGHVRDVDGKVRPITTEDLKRNAEAHYESRGLRRTPQPGEVGYAPDLSTVKDADLKRDGTAADLQRIADAYWKRLH